MNEEVAKPKVLEDVPDDCMCAVCQDILVNPVQTKCGHYFCWECVHEAFVRKSECPCSRKGCKEEANIDELESVITGKRHRVFKNMLFGLEVGCAHTGCFWRGTYRDWIDHEKCCPEAEMLCGICGTKEKMKDRIECLTTENRMLRHREEKCFDEVSKAFVINGWEAGLDWDLPEYVSFLIEKLEYVMERNFVQSQRYSNLRIENPFENVKPSETGAHRNSNATNPAAKKLKFN